MFPPELNKFDLQLCLSKAPAKVLDMMRKYHSMAGAPLICAGGFIRAVVSGEKVSDMDLFSSGKFSPSQAAADLKLAMNSTRKIHTSNNAHTVWTSSGFPIQFIHRWKFDNPQECIDSFDFTIAKAAFWMGNGGWQSVVDERFYQDLAAKRLVYTAPIREEEPGGSLMRVLKFYQRGYHIPLDSMAKVLARATSELGNSSLVYDEVGYTKYFLERLKDAYPHKEQPVAC